MMVCLANEKDVVHNNDDGILQERVPFLQGGERHRASLKVTDNHDSAHEDEYNSQPEQPTHPAPQRPHTKCGQVVWFLLLFLGVMVIYLLYSKLWDYLVQRGSRLHAPSLLLVTSGVSCVAAAVVETALGRPTTRRLPLAYFCILALLGMLSSYLYRQSNTTFSVQTAVPSGRPLVVMLMSRVMMRDHGPSSWRQYGSVALFCGSSAFLMQSSVRLPSLTDAPSLGKMMAGVALVLVSISLSVCALVCTENLLTVDSVSKFNFACKVQLIKFILVGAGALVFGQVQFLATHVPSGGIVVAADTRLAGVLSTSVSLDSRFPVGCCCKQSLDLGESCCVSKSAIVCHVGRLWCALRLIVTASGCLGVCGRDGAVLSRSRFCNTPQLQHLTVLLCLLASCHHVCAQDVPGRIQVRSFVRVVGFVTAQNFCDNQLNPSRAWPVHRFLPHCEAISTIPCSMRALDLMGSKASKPLQQQ